MADDELVVAVGLGDDHAPRAGGRRRRVGLHEVHGLQAAVVGEGDEAAAGSIVEVHYVGHSWSTGDQFDASWDRGDTFKFGLGKGQVIKGWDDGVAGMRVGGRRRITIPPAMGYGKRGFPPVIKPDETLVFVVDLVSLS